MVELLEIDVIIGVVIWLHSNGWRTERISIPTGQPITVSEQKERVRLNLTGAAIPIENLKFFPHGADIEAKRNDEIWRIECKGLTTGKDATVKNNFDRAIASAVSYYTQREGLRIGVALPDVRYLKYVQGKLPKPLRQAVNLWIFLYVAQDEIYVWNPEEEFEP